MKYNISGSIRFLSILHRKRCKIRNRNILACWPLIWSTFCCTCETLQLIDSKKGTCNYKSYNYRTQKDNEWLTIKGKHLVPKIGTMIAWHNLDNSIPLNEETWLLNMIQRWTIQSNLNMDRKKMICVQLNW